MNGGGQGGDGAAAALIGLFRLNSRLFLNAIVDLDEDAGRIRPNQSTNSVAFIGGHLVETRAWMGRFLGLDTPAPFGGALEHATGIDDVAELPTLAAIRTQWESVSRPVLERLEQLGPDELAGPSRQRFPGVAETVVGAVAFLAQHESYHLGQLGLLRKYLGLGPMSYR